VAWRKKFTWKFCPIFIDKQQRQYLTTITKACMSTSLKAVSLLSKVTYFAHRYTVTSKCTKVNTVMSSKSPSVAQWANALAEPQCSEQVAWVRLPLKPACRVRFLHAMRLKFSGRYRGFACVTVSSLKCNRPSHPDWGRLGVVRATGADNR